MVDRFCVGEGFDDVGIEDNDVGWFGHLLGAPDYRHVLKTFFFGILVHNWLPFEYFSL